MTRWFDPLTELLKRAKRWVFIGGHPVVQA